MSDVENRTEKHLDEITLLLYVERQLERDAAQEVSLHTQTCERCLTLLRALDRESRLLTRSLVEQDEELPARLAEFHDKAKRSMQWIWGVVFGLGVIGIYALYAEYVEPLERQLDQAGFGSSNLVSLLVFQGAFWKGWQSMVTLVEFVALASAAGFGLFAIRRYLRRGAALAVMFASLGFLMAFSVPASATEFRKAETVEVKKDEVLKSDLFVMSDHIRIEGTVDGDVYGMGEQVEVTGRVTGDVICFCQSLRVSGQVDGNVRNMSNNLTITGTVDHNVSSFTEIFTLDPNGKIGHSLIAFSKSLTLDGSVGRDFLAMFAKGDVGGNIGGDFRARAESLSIGSTASIGGKAIYHGDNPASVSSGARLASPLEFTKLEHHRTERGFNYYLWRGIWAVAFILFGLVLFWLMPLFSGEATQNVENVGASFGLGVLVGFAVPFAALLACITVVGLFVGLSSLFLWYSSLYFAQVIVGAAVGSWILGRAHDTWGLVGRMAIGVLLLRASMAVPYIGVWLKFAVIVWGIGAISLAVYRRLQPTVAPNIPSVPLPPVTAPLPPNTTVGGI